MDLLCHWALPVVLSYSVLVDLETKKQKVLDNEKEVIFIKSA